MHNILVAGAGKIGSLVADFLSSTEDYRVFLADVKNESSNSKVVALDVADDKAVKAFINKHKIHAVVACLPFFLNVKLAKVARIEETHYFDLTEDIHVSAEIKKLAKGAKTAFVPHCGLAPGFVDIVAHDMIREFDSVETVLICAGALPASPHNTLKYALTWSTEGLINEYMNPCLALEDGKKVTHEPLEGLESIEIDGLQYEAFNTSGGLGTLTDSLENKVNTLNYKTIRYPGHCEKIRFLFNDLKLKDDRETLKRIFENALPTTLQDVVIVYVAVKGHRDNQLVEDIYVKKMYPDIVGEHKRTAIQLATASGVCAVLDNVLQNPNDYQGMILQETFSLKDITQNRFGHYYSTETN